jgi:hypothetical protein
MVYLRKILNQNKKKLIQSKNIELVAYYFIKEKQALAVKEEFELTGEESIAFKGYNEENIDPKIVTEVLSRPAVKGIDASTNIYKFCGLYLAAKETLLNTLLKKFNGSSLIQKYFLTKIEPSLSEKLSKELSNIDASDHIANIIKFIQNPNNTEGEVIQEGLVSILMDELDVQKQVLLEDFERALFKPSFDNKTPEEIIKEIFYNFSNSVQKIIKGRRKGHDLFKIEDEYDVQDILYVILKSIFPSLRDEDPIPKVGSKSTKIDLILRDQGILIEVKMIKVKDTSENDFIEQLKIDFESYHQCQWLTTLFCFVYDPYKKTKDKTNFYDLNGVRTKNNKTFNIEVFVSD